jgi:hypothetical protein
LHLPAKDRSLILACGMGGNGSAATRGQGGSVGQYMSKRENKAAAAEFRELAGMDFDQFTRQAPVKVLLALAKFAGPVDITVLQFANETHPLFEQQREKLLHALRSAWQRKDPETAPRRRQMAEVVRRYRE